MDLKKMDLDSLDELIARCEDSMCRPFRKKPAPEAEGVAVEHEEEEGDDKPDLSEMDMEDLLRMYEEMKAKE